MDALDYGRRFTVDAFRLDSSLQVDEGLMRDALDELYAFVESPRSGRQIVYYDDLDGMSSAVCGDEAHAAIHLFHQLGTVSLQVFSRRDVLLSDVTDFLARRFGVGRFESHLGNATKALPKDPDRLRSLLSGDRSFARVRLDERLLGL